MRGRGLEQGAQASGARRGRKTPIPPRRRGCVRAGVTRGKPYRCLLALRRAMCPPRPSLLQGLSLARISLPTWGPTPSVASLRRSVRFCGVRVRPGHVGRRGSGSGQCGVPGTLARYAVGRRKQRIYPPRPTCSSGFGGLTRQFLTRRCTQSPQGAPALWTFF